MQVSYASLFVAANSAVQKEKTSCVRIEQKNVFIIIVDMYKLHILYYKTVGQSMQTDVVSIVAI